MPELIVPAPVITDEQPVTVGGPSVDGQGLSEEVPDVEDDAG